MTQAQEYRNTKLKVTKGQYTRLLSVVGKSRRALSTYEIMKGLNRLDRSAPPRYTYRMIKTLAGDETFEGKRQSTRSRQNYLDITLKQKCLDRVTELEKARDKSFHRVVDYFLGMRDIIFDAPVTDDDERAKDEIAKMCFRTGNRRYSLNIRGFLLLIYCESKSEISVGKRRRVREIIENPIIKDLAPFLLFWEHFEKAGFDAVKKLGYIAQELYYYILDPETGMDFLILKVTERYFNEVLGFFSLFYKLGILKARRERLHQEHYKKYFELDIPSKLVEYRLRMLNLQKELLSKELDRVETCINSIQ